MYLTGQAKQAIVRRYIANGTVQPNMVVMVNEVFHQAVGLLKRSWFSGPDALAFKRTVESFELAIALWIVWARTHMAETGYTNELLEVLSDELRSVITDDSRLSIRVLFKSSLHDDLDVRLFHRWLDLPMNDESALTIEH